MTRDEAIKRSEIFFRVYDPVGFRAQENALADLLLAAHAEGRAVGRRGALEEATRAAESAAVDRHAGSEWNRGVGFAVSRIRELVAKEGA